MTWYRDIITADGTGEAAVANYVRKHGRAAMADARSNELGVTSRQSQETSCFEYECVGRGRNAPE